MSALTLRAIARALGGEVNGGQVSAPGPGHSRQDRSMRVRLSPGALEGFVVVSYAGDDFAACRDHVRARLGLDADGWKRERQAPAAELVREEADDDGSNRRLAAAIVAGVVPLKGTPGEAYLREVRGIDTSAIADLLERADAIGWHSSVYFNKRGHELHGRMVGCIVGVMTDAATVAPSGAISRTYIHDGAKVMKAKTLGTPAGIVRLSSDDDVTSGLFIAEGVETALTAAAIGLRPIWSTGSTAIMSSFPPLAGIECISIIADNDEGGAGLAAAAACAGAWRTAGREARILMRDRPGDLNDALRGAE